MTSDDLELHAVGVRGAMPSRGKLVGVMQGSRVPRHRERLGNTGNTGNTGSTGTIVHGRSSTATILEEFVTSCTKASRVIGRTVDGFEHVRGRGPVVRRAKPLQNAVVLMANMQSKVIERDGALVIETHELGVIECHDERRPSRSWPKQSRELCRPL